MPAGSELDGLARRLRRQLVREASSGDTDVDSRIRALVEREAGVLGEEARADLVRLISERAVGLGRLEPLLADPEVDEVIVNGAGRSGLVWIERHGRLERTNLAFADEAELRHVIERILAPLGRRADEAEPMVDCRLPDGSRVNVVLPPLAVDGPVLTIRRFRRHGLGPADLVSRGTWTPELHDHLACAVREGRNIIVSGGTGSGKTTTLNALSALIPDGERIVTIEDTAELRLQQPHVVRLEARPANVEGRGAVTIRQLIRNALRMRPDRIVVGEVRGGEALDMLAAMSTGHDGSLSTVHAGSPAEALRRIATLALMGDVAVPHAAVSDQLGSAVDLIVHQVRMPDGRRCVSAVAEVQEGATGPVAQVIYARSDDGKARWPARGLAGTSAPRGDGEPRPPSREG